MANRRRAPLRLFALLATFALVAAGCGGGDDEEAGRTGGDGGGDGTATTAAPMPAPLTGLLVDGAGVLQRPAITIKVDNGPQGRPQSGIDKADILIEEKVEGGITRFLAVFHSQDAELVGPVRSVRSTDPELVAALGGVFAFAGGIPEFERQARQQPVTVVSESVSAEGFQYPAAKRRPFKTYTDTPKLRSLAKDRTQPPPRFFEFLAAGGAFAPAGAAPATSAGVSFGRTSFAVDFDATAGSWKRSTDGRPHTIENGGQLAFTNVIIQRTTYQATPFKDPSGSRVDEAVVVGSGDAIVLSQGKQAAVKWNKASATAVTTYTDSAGAPVKLPPGRTLVALSPAAAAITVR